MKRISQFALLLMVPVMALPVAAQKNNSKDKNQQNTTAAAPAQAAPAAALPVANDTSYVIGPGDDLNISVWDNDNLSGAVTVRPDGMISLPLLNDVPASGKTPMQLRDVLVEKIGATGVKTPLVTVTVKATNSQRIYVLGNVGRAGAYPMIPGMNVLQGISSAGGLTLFAKHTKIMVLRTENGQQVRLPFNYDSVLKGKTPEQNISLKPGDTIIVP
jgi:polysaccharide export outer membrane protein